MSLILGKKEIISVRYYTLLNSLGKFTKVIYKGVNNPFNEPYRRPIYRGYEKQLRVYMENFPDIIFWDSLEAVIPPFEEACRQNKVVNTIEPKENQNYHFPPVVMEKQMVLLLNYLCWHHSTVYDLPKVSFEDLLKY